jgi:hypothetical protein
MQGHYPVMYGSYGRRGAGIGSIFSSLFSRLVPIVKTALGVGRRALASQAGQKLAKAAKRSAMTAGLNVVGDALAGEHVGKSAKREIAKARADMGRVIKNLDPKQLRRSRGPRPKPRFATMRPRGTGGRKKKGRKAKYVKTQCKMVKKKRCKYGTQFVRIKKGKKKRGKKGKVKRYRDLFDL